MGRSRYRFPVYTNNDDAVARKRSDGKHYVDPLMRARGLGLDDVDDGLGDERELQEFLREMEENMRHADDDDDDSDSEEDDDKKKRGKRPWMAPMGIFLPEYSVARGGGASPSPPVISVGATRARNNLHEGDDDDEAPFRRWRRPSSSFRQGGRMTTRWGAPQPSTSDVYASWHRLPASVKFQPYKYHHGLLGATSDEDDDDDESGGSGSTEENDDDGFDGLRKRYVLGKRRFVVPTFSRPRPASEESGRPHRGGDGEDDDDDEERKRSGTKRRFMAPPVRAGRRRNDDDEEEDEDDDKKKRQGPLPQPPPPPGTTAGRDRRDPPPLPMGGDKFSDYFGFDRRRKREAVVQPPPQSSSSSNSTTTTAVAVSVAAADARKPTVAEPAASEARPSSSDVDNNGEKGTRKGGPPEVGDDGGNDDEYQTGSGEEDATESVRRRKRLAKRAGGDTSKWLKSSTFDFMRDWINNRGRDGHEGRDPLSGPEPAARWAHRSPGPGRPPTVADSELVAGTPPFHIRNQQHPSAREDKRMVMLKKRVLVGKRFRFGREDDEDDDCDPSSRDESDEDDDEKRRKKRVCLRKKRRYIYGKVFFDKDDEEDDDDSDEEDDEKKKKKRFAVRRKKQFRGDDDDDSDEDDDSEEEEKRKKRKKRVLLKRSKKNFRHFSEEEEEDDDDDDDESEEDEAERELDQRLSRLADDILGEVRDMERSREVYPISELEDRLEAVDLIHKIQDKLESGEDSSSSSSSEEDDEEDEKKKKKKKRALKKRSSSFHFPPNALYLNKRLNQEAQECPALENILGGCVRASKMAGDSELRFVDACNLHQLCTLCGEGFKLLSSNDCDSLFLDKMESVCPGKEHGCLEVAYRMTVAVDKLSPGGEEDPNQCYQETCVAHYLKREFGRLIPFS